MPDPTPSRTAALDTPDGTRPRGMPDDTPTFMTPAWTGCMRWAIGRADIRAEFEASTGMRWTPPQNGLDRMIDEATGHGAAYVEQFVAWANAALWGPMDGGGDG